MLLKARLAVLKARSPKVLNTLLGQSEAHLMKCTLGMLFWHFLKKHKAGLDTLFYFLYFLIT